MNQKLVKKSDPKASPPPNAIGPYSIVKAIGRGGMGEVFLARDPTFGRELALKRIRPDLAKNQTILQRFLREAKVASQLAHPAIVPILSIQNAPPDVYYTMPYIEGETLRQVLRSTLEAEQKGETSHPIGRSIGSLSRIFLQICEAIAYTHSKGVLHRDLKPENIIVGKYGQVMILDWGIADFIDELSSSSDAPTSNEADLTRPGKIAGTLAYMAPERLKGETSSVQADIYALGVMLYYILTLQLPFQRKTLAAFRKSAGREQLVDPIEAAPYRDIPHQLAAVCCKCLAFAPEKRFQSVEELIAEIKKTSEGQAQWIPMAALSPSKSDDWQFQENILLSKHIAISRALDETSWAALMVSRKEFASNVKIETRVRLHPDGVGIGLLLSIPLFEERRMLDEGYCLWLQASECRLYRNNVQVFSAPRGLSVSEWKDVCIEKVEDVIKLYIDRKLVFAYTSHLPLAGSHVGVLQRDSSFDIETIEVSDVSNNAYVRCLAVPNAFLSHKLYDLALQDYRRIGQSFPGRQEGREALFRAGVALLEKAKAQRTKQLKEQYCHKALKEFGNLYHTSGAPLEFLGKSLVYDALGEPEEEAKCLELALRKFPKHPLAVILKEHIIYRMHESSQTMRDTAYRIILLAIRHIPELLELTDTRSLIDSLQRNLEQLPFFQPTEEDFLYQISIQLAFWLAKPPILGEIAASLTKRTPVPSVLIENALFCLLELEAKTELEKQLSALPPDAISNAGKAALQTALSGKLAQLPTKPSYLDARLISHFLRKALVKRRFFIAEDLANAALKKKWSPRERLPIVAHAIWLHLLRRNVDAAGKLLSQFSPEELNLESSPLHFAYGTFLYVTEGPDIAQAHFSGVMDTPFPCTTALPSHFLLGRIDGKKGWIERAFWWEKKELHRQLDFFYYAIGKKRK